MLKSFSECRQRCQEATDAAGRAGQGRAGQGRAGQGRAAGLCPHGLNKSIGTESLTHHDLLTGSKATDVAQSCNWEPLGIEWDC